MQVEYGNKAKPFADTGDNKLVSPTLVRFPLKNNMPEAGQPFFYRLRNLQ